MKLRGHWQLWGSLLGVCVLLLLLIDPAPSAAKPEPVEISVILREADSNASARQGMEQAAGDLQAELRVLTLSRANCAEEQRALLEREVTGGADAILLIPVDRSTLSEEVRRAAGEAIIVTMETEMQKSGAAACISVDNTKLGQALAEAAMRGVPKGGTVLLLDSLPGDNGVTERLLAAEAALQNGERQILRCRSYGEESLSDALRAALQQTHPAAVVAMESSALETAAQVVHQETKAPLVYGTGATSAIAAALEQNDLTAILAQNEFAAGYLAVQAAVCAVRHENSSIPEQMPFFTVRRETMYTPELEKLLFPVTR